MDQALGRKTYAVLAIVLGLPTLATGGLFVLTALFLGVVALIEDPSMAMPVLAAGIGGLLGLAGWAVLSWLYWRGGSEGLRRAPRWAWLGLAAGCIVAAWFLAVAGADYPKYAAEGGLMLGLVLATVLPRGPLLLPLALYLALAALWPQRRAKAAGSG